MWIKSSRQRILNPTVEDKCNYLNATPEQTILTRKDFFLIFYDSSQSAATNPTPPKSQLLSTRNK
jgi:hypothetical protein